MLKVISDVLMLSLKELGCPLIHLGAHRYLLHREPHGLLKRASPLHGSSSSSFPGSCDEFKVNHQVMGVALNTQPL
jgi:hypothetical protein